MKQRSHETVLVIVTTILLVFAGAARAELLVATDLNVGGTDVGFSGNWAGSANVSIQDLPDLTYANYFITQSGTEDRIYQSNAGPDRQKVRALESAMSDEIWFTMLVNVPEIAGRDGYAGITFNNYGNTWDPITTGARILLGDSLQVGFNGGTATVTGSFARDTTHLILGQMIVGDGNDTLSVWISPDLTSVTSPAGLPDATYSNTEVEFADSIVSVGVAGRTTTNGGPPVYMDAIWMSNRDTAFYDVTGIPEPSTVALVGLFLAAMAIRRRRG